MIESGRVDTSRVPFREPAIAVAVLGTSAAFVLYGVRHPATAVLLGLAMVVFVCALMAPRALVQVGLLSLIAAPEWYPHFAGSESTLLRGHQLLILAAFTPMLLSRGIKGAKVPYPVMAYSAIFIVGLAFSSSVGGLTRSASLFLVIESCFVWTVAQMDWRREDVRPILVTIALAPLMSVIAGWIVMQIDWSTVTSLEYTGARRLQGATIPAYLGALATMGTAASTLLIAVGPRRVGWALAALNFTIVSLTITRGGVIASIIILLPTIARTVSRSRRTTSPQLDLLRSAWFVVVLVGALFLFSSLVESRNERSDGNATSGRSDAWSYFWDEAQVNPIFGRGLNSVVVLGSAAQGLDGDFRQAHNEYLQIFVEGGIVGVVLIIGSIVALIAQRFRSTAPSLRVDLGFLLAATAIYSFTDNTLSLIYLLPFVCIVGLYVAARPWADTTSLAPTRAIGAPS